MMQLNSKAAETDKAMRLKPGDRIERIQKDLLEKL